jgi:hypothetical protein
MKNKTVFAAAAALVAAMATSPASALTVGFDDIDASAGDVPLEQLNPYQGFTWSGFSAYTATPGFIGFNNGIVSAANAAYGGADGPTGLPAVDTISSTQLFDFSSAFVGAGYYDNLSVTFQGLRNGAVVYSQSVLANASAAANFTSFNFSGIDALSIFSTPTGATSDPFTCGTSNCGYFTLDDLVFQLDGKPGPVPPSTIPEPHGLPLAGLIALAAVSMRRRRHDQSPQ